MTRREVRIGWALLATGIVLLVLWGFIVVRTGYSFWSHTGQAVALLEKTGFQHQDLERVCGLIKGIQADLTILKREVGGPLRLAPALGWLPRVGSDLRAAPYLLETAFRLSTAGKLVCNPLQKAFRTQNPDGFGELMDTLLPALAVDRASLEQAVKEVQAARAAWDHVDVQALSPPLARYATPLDRALPLVEAAVHAAVLAPDLLGLEQARTYLVLAQNEDELRPTGGFLTGVGEVKVERGQVVAMTFRDSYTVDDFSRPYPDPPEALQRYMGIDLWVFRDSNWSPDFPTAARQALALYRPGYPVAVDGVVAVDQYTLQELVGAIGPLQVSGIPQPVTRETLIPAMRKAWAPESGVAGGDWWSQRKAFMGDLAEAIWKRIQAGPVDERRLAATLLRLLREKHILLFFADPEAQALAAQQNWDGALRAGTGDFLMVVDANVGYNKASALVQASLAYNVDLSRNPPRATLTLTYTHTAPAGYPCYPEVRYDAVYERMMERCYWNDVRIYVPEGSRLVEAVWDPVPVEALWPGRAEVEGVRTYLAEEGPFVVFEGLVLVPPGTTQVRQLVWELPGRVVAWQDGEGLYTLRVQKQPGTAGHPLQVRVRLGDHLTLVAAQPSPTWAKGGEVEFEARLNEDREFRLVLRRKQ